MKYGHLELHIEELLKEKGISKNTICKELDIPRSNFNRYCRNEFQRLDAQLICKLCSYLDCGIADAIRRYSYWRSWCLPDRYLPCWDAPWSRFPQSSR